MRTTYLRKRRSGPGWPGIFLLALAIQLPVFELVVALSDQQLPPDGQRKERPVLVGEVVFEQEPEPEPEPPTPPDGQIVEVPQIDDDEDAPPVDTKYLADRNARTLKETRSAVVAPPDKAQRPGLVKPEKVSEVQSSKSDSADPTVTTDEEKELALAPQQEDLPEADEGEKKPDSVLYEGRKNSLLVPSTSKKAELANLQALSGAYQTDDYLPELDRGESTLLNANKYKYADFFYRVKDAVRRHWHPNRVYRRRDPTGKVYGVKDRHTVLHVTLDDTGKLKNLTTRKYSGLDFLDAEAKNAITQAQPFLNPPRGLVDPAGEIKFEFGFFFEISSGKYRFRWKRL